MYEGKLEFRNVVADGLELVDEILDNDYIVAIELSAISRGEE